MRSLTCLVPILLLAACTQKPPQQPQSKAAVVSEPPVAVAPTAPPASTPAPAPPPPQPVAQQQQQPKPVTYTAKIGHPVRVRVTSAISSKSARAGDAVQGVLAEPITVRGVVVAPRGAKVSGAVASVDPGGRVKGVASVAVRMTRLEIADGRSVDIATSLFIRKAPATKKKDALKVGIGSGVGAAIGAIAGGGKGAAIGAGSGAGAGTGAVLLTRGDPAVIPSESVLTFTLRKPVSYTR